MHSLPLLNSRTRRRTVAGVTGAEGFIGKHLLSAAGKMPHELQILPLKRESWDDPAALAKWSGECDCIIHLAGESRSADGAALYRTNMELCRRLALHLRSGQRLIFGSTTHAYIKDLPYHASKRDGAALFYQAAAECGAEFIELLMPNTFGENGKPFFNSVISTFCYQSARGETMRIDAPEAELSLIYAEDLALEIIKLCLDRRQSGQITIPAQFEVKLGETAAILQKFAAGDKPEAGNSFEEKLCRTWLSYLP